MFNNDASLPSATGFHSTGRQQHYTPTTGGPMPMPPPPPPVAPHLSSQRMPSDGVRGSRAEYLPLGDLLPEPLAPVPPATELYPWPTPRNPSTGMAVDALDANDLNVLAAGASQALMNTSIARHLRVKAFLRPFLPQSLAAILAYPCECRLRVPLHLSPTNHPCFHGEALKRQVMKVKALRRKKRRFSTSASQRKPLMIR